MVPAASLEATFDATLLHPPADVVSAASSFYPPELFKTEKRVRDYLIEKQLADRSGHRSYQDQSAVRPPDQLDRLFRGPLGTEEDLDFIYRPNPKAGECMHSKNTWKSVLSHSGTHTATLSLIPTHCDSLEDDLATANPSLDKQRAKVEQLFQANSKWIQLQKVSMRQTNDRFEHLVFLLKVRLDSLVKVLNLRRTPPLQDEMKKEHEREACELACTVGRKKAQLDVYKERLDSVDLVGFSQSLPSLPTSITGSLMH